MKGVLVIAALLVASAVAVPHGCSRQLSTTLLPDFKDCAGFWTCAQGEPLFRSCPEGLHFSDRLQRCTLPIFARCLNAAGDASTHTADTHGFWDTLINLISGKAQPIPLENDELPAPPDQTSDEITDEKGMIRRFPDAEAEVPELSDEADKAEGDTEEAQESEVPASENEEEKSSDVEVEGESDTKEDVEKEEQLEDGKQDEQDESEKSEEKIVKEEDEEKEEKVNEKSEIEDPKAGSDGKNMEEQKNDATVVKKEDEEEEDENKKESKDVKSVKKESKKSKSEEKAKDSGSDDESDDEE